MTVRKKRILIEQEINEYTRYNIILLEENQLSVLLTIRQKQSDENLKTVFRVGTLSIYRVMSLWYGNLV